MYVIYEQADVFRHSCVSFLPPPDDITFLRTAHELYVQHQKFPEAMAVALRLGDPDLVFQDFQNPGNPCVLRRLPSA